MFFSEQSRDEWGPREKKNLFSLGGSSTIQSGKELFDSLHSSYGLEKNVGKVNCASDFIITYLGTDVRKIL